MAVTIYQWDNGQRKYCHATAGMEVYGRENTNRSWVLSGFKVKGPVGKKSHSLMKYAKSAIQLVLSFLFYLFTYLVVTFVCFLRQGFSVQPWLS